MFERLRHVVLTGTVIEEALDRNNKLFLQALVGLRLAVLWHMLK